jgi:tetratricopeptide (TPR) repeat protein
VRRLHLDEIESLPLRRLGLDWRPVRRALGISAFGINAYHGAHPGDLVVEDHSDPHQELYVVLRGSARFRAGNEEFDAPAGTLVLLEPEEHRVAHAAESDTLVLAVGAESERFEPSAWEYGFRGRALFDLGRADDAWQAIADGLERYPDRGVLRYTRAVLNGARGDDEAALADLRRAVEIYPDFAGWAQEEPELARVRDRL